GSPTSSTPSLAGRKARSAPSASTDPHPNLGGPVAIRFNVSNRPAPDVRADLLAVPVYADRELGPGADAVDAALDGTLTSFMEESGFEGKPGETLLVPLAGRMAAKAALLVGLGKRADQTVDGLRRAAAAIARRATKVNHVATTLVDVAPEAGEPPS